MNKMLHTSIFILQLIQMSACETMFFGGKRNSSNTFTHFHCKLSIAPVGDTVEFLVSDITAFNIRIYGDSCYVTDSQFPCNETKCKCSPDGKDFKWVYYHKADLSYKASCRAKIQEDCFIRVNLRIDGVTDLHDFETEKCDGNPPSSVSFKRKGNRFIVVAMFSFLMNGRQSGSSILFFIFSIIVATTLGASKPNMTLKVDYQNNQIELTCKVKYLVNEVYFHDPSGRLRGSCTAPVPAKAPGTCDKLMGQNIDDNTTYLVTTITRDEDGMWICFHGMNTQETAYVSVNADYLSDEDQSSASWFSYGFMTGSFVCLIFIAAYILWKKMKNKKADDSRKLIPSDSPFKDLDRVKETSDKSRVEGTTSTTEIIVRHHPSNDEISSSND